MNDYAEICIYMGHKGGPDAQLEELIKSCLKKLATAITPLYVTTLLPCEVSDDRVQIDTLEIESKLLARHLFGCTQAYVFAATLGAAVDRLIAQRAKIDSAEALCLQACAAAEVENYCNRIERELSGKAEKRKLFLRPRFSPGYGDFDIAHQTGLLRVLEAHKRIGLSETKTHMLTPLKSVTAIIGAGESIMENAKTEKCAACDKTDCAYQER
ncbi:MAG: hypothetical protein LBU82_05405 [Treponema sp.]|jgi:hypothetical protein|nr:hypothetical protein [Treponema sp.]